MNSYTRSPSYAANQPLAQNRQAFSTTSTRAMPGVNSAGAYRGAYQQGPVQSSFGRPPGARTYQGSGQTTPFRIPDDPRMRFWSGGNPWPIQRPYGMPQYATQPGISSLPHGGWFQPTRSPILQALNF